MKIHKLIYRIVTIFLLMCNNKLLRVKNRLTLQPPKISPPCQAPTGGDDITPYPGCHGYTQLLLAKISTHTRHSLIFLCFPSLSASSAFLTSLSALMHCSCLILFSLISSTFCFFSSTAPLYTFSSLFHASSMVFSSMVLPLKRKGITRGKRGNKDKCRDRDGLHRQREHRCEHTIAEVEKGVHLAQRVITMDVSQA